MTDDLTASWAAFPRDRARGGALPVTFCADGENDH